MLLNNNNYKNNRKLCRPTSQPHQPKFQIMFHEKEPIAGLYQKGLWHLQLFSRHFLLSSMPQFIY
jgi:hypothetical protein